MRRAGVAILIVIVLGAITFLMREKSVSHPMAPSFVTAHYRGLGLDDMPGLLGRQWSGITYVYDTHGGSMHIDYAGPGPNKFTRYYKDGSVSEEGLIPAAPLEGGLHGDLPYPGEDPIQSRSYHPDGSLVAEVRDGTGVQLIHFDDGTPYWELHLEDGQRTRLRKWYENGQLRMDKHHDNGNVELRGEYKNGKPHGTWTRYHPDGSIKSEETHNADAPERPGYRFMLMSAFPHNRNARTDPPR